MFTPKPLCFALLSVVMLNSATHAQHVNCESVTMEAYFPFLKFEQQYGDPYVFSTNSARLKLVAGGGKRPFEIYSAAPTDSFKIAESGIGMGVKGPVLAPLHIYGEQESLTAAYPNPWIYVQNDSAAVGDRNMIVLSNRGGSNILFENTFNFDRLWRVGQSNGGAFRVTLD